MQGGSCDVLSMFYGCFYCCYKLIVLQEYVASLIWSNVIYGQPFKVSLSMDLKYGVLLFYAFRDMGPME